MKQATVKLINAVVGSTTITSAAVDARQWYRISGQVITGAGAATAGSLQLQYSCDPFSTANFGTSNVVTGPSHWSNFGTAVTVSGAATQSILFLTDTKSDVCYSWVRAVYTDTSGGTGAGTITVQLVVQEV